jgi:hypothetical protein
VAGTGDAAARNLMPTYLPFSDSFLTRDGWYVRDIDFTPHMPL